MVAVSTAIGPTIAAGILSLGTWQWLFAVNVPLGVVAFVLALRALPDTRRAPYRFDLGSAALNAATFGFLIFGIGEAAHSADLFVTLAALAVAMVSGVVLIYRQLGLPAPMLPVDLYRRPMFALSSLTSLCSFAAQGLSFVSLPFYFQTVLGFSAVETGLLLTPWPVMTGDRRADRRAAVGPLPAGDPGRHRTGDPVRRPGADRDIAGGSRRFRHRLADDGLRRRVWVLPVAQPEGDHVERSARTQRRRQRHRRDFPPGRPGDRRRAGGALLRHFDAARAVAGLGAGRGVLRRGQCGELLAAGRDAVEGAGARWRRKGLRLTTAPLNGRYRLRLIQPAMSLTGRRVPAS